MQTVKLATNTLPDTNQVLRRRSSLTSMPHYEVEAPYDPDRLTARAKAMLDAAGAWFTTFYDSDDLTPTLHLRHRCMSIEDAADLIARDDGERALYRQRAAIWRATYGEHMGPRTETIDATLPLARLDDLRDATDYLNRLAATPGVGVRRQANATPVWLDDVVIETGAKPWRHVLMQDVAAAEPLLPGRADR